MATPAFRQYPSATSGSSFNFDGQSRFEQSPPSLYPPRKLPQVLNRSATHRDFDHTYSHECAILFSGFKVESEGIDESKYKYNFRKIIGKQQILQEIDLDAQLTPFVIQHLQKNTTQTITAIDELQQPAKSTRGKGTTPSPTSPFTTTITSPTNQYQITSNNSLVLTGSAMWTFPAEIRTFFFRLVEPLGGDSHIDKKAALSLGLGVFRRNTPLGFCSQRDNIIPAHLSTLFDLKKRNTFSRLVAQFAASTTFNLPSKYESRVVQPPASIAAKEEAKRRKLAKQLKKMKAAEENQDDDSELSLVRSKKRSTIDTTNDDDAPNDNSDGESDVDDNNDDNDDDDDTDFGEVHDDDDDDYGDAASGDDEPTF